MRLRNAERRNKTEGVQGGMRTAEYWISWKEVKWRRRIVSVSCAALSGNGWEGKFVRGFRAVILGVL